MFNGILAYGQKLGLTPNKNKETMNFSGWWRLHEIYR